VALALATNRPVVNDGRIMPRFAARMHHHAEFDADELAAVKGGHTISVCLPARDEATTVGAIVRTLRAELVDATGLVDEVLVVDDGSSDATAAIARDAGARVTSTSEVLVEHVAGTGKGEALWRSVAAAEGDLIVWCDADIVDFDARFVVGLIGPLLTRPEIGFVKGYYDRPIDGVPSTGGRVTELVARPLIALLFPRLSSIVQPLSGEYAGRREVLEAVPFVQSYGVDLGLLIDISARFGLDTIAQVDLGVRHHRNRTLEQLSPQALAVMQTAFAKAHVTAQAGSAPTLVRPGSEDITLRHVERPPLAELASYRRRLA
jgi:glucosyl-3-phosphoglycerate synthase